MRERRVSHTWGQRRMRCYDIGRASQKSLTKKRITWSVVVAFVGGGREEKGTQQEKGKSRAAGLDGISGEGVTQAITHRG